MPNRSYAFCMTGSPTGHLTYPRPGPSPPWSNSGHTAYHNWKIKTLKKTSIWKYNHFFLRHLLLSMALTPLHDNYSSLWHLSIFVAFTYFYGIYFYLWHLFILWHSFLYMAFIYLYGIYFFLWQLLPSMTITSFYGIYFSPWHLLLSVAFTFPLTQWQVRQQLQHARKLRTFPFKYQGLRRRGLGGALCLVRGSRQRKGLFRLFRRVSV